MNGQPMGLLPAMIGDLQTAVLRGDRAAVAGLQGRRDAAGPPITRAGSIAVVKLYGVITQHAGTWWGGTDLDTFGGLFRNMVADPSIGSVILAVDSPGGEVSGISELSAEIYQARAKKRIICVCDSLCASAAYWLGSAASEVIVTPGGECGSIGVYGAHMDTSKALEMDGLKITLIAAGRYKVEGNQFEPLSTEARGALQVRVDDFYRLFVRDVARNRGVPEFAVASGYGEGRLLTAQAAVKAGLADKIAPLVGVVQREALLLAVGGPSSHAKALAKAQADAIRLRML